MFGLGAHVESGMGIPADGINSYGDWQNFAKAVQTSGYETDHAALTDSQALRVESLERTLRAVVEKDETFKLWRALKRTPVGSAVHEYNIQTNIGGQPMGMFNSETGNIASDVGSYERRITQVKYLMTQAQVSHVAQVQKGMVDLKATENTNALMRLSRAVNVSLYHGDSKVSPMQFDGLDALIGDFQNGSHVLDLKGTSDVASLIDAAFSAMAEVIGQGNFGKVTDMLIDPHVQNELDRDLDPAYRVYLENNPGSIQRGAPVSALKTSFGPITMQQDIWIRSTSNSLPQYALSLRNNMKWPDTAPGKVTAVAAAQTAVASSQFEAGQAGTYAYYVCAVDERGLESLPSDRFAGAVAGGGALEITITPNGDLKQTGYNLYRGRQDVATAELSDVRLVKAIPANPSRSAATVFVDDNTNIPGSGNMYLLNLVPESISWLQLLPATQFPLFATTAAVIPWAVLLYGALQLGIPNHHFILKNFVCKRATWQPFTV